MALAAMVPLFSVLAMLIWRGGQRFSLHLFTEVAPAPGMAGGGIGNALVGTLLMVAIASLIAVPFGVLAGVYLTEFGPDTKLSSTVRFAAKVLSGLPSVLAGLFAYAAVVLATGTYSAPAGGIALSILMLPTVLLTTEQAIKMVPQRMREAAMGMGGDADPVGLAGRAACGHARYSDRCDVGGGPRRRGNSPAPVHRHVQRLLADPESHGADAVAGRANLQLLQPAFPQPSGDCLGGVAGPGASRIIAEHRRAKCGWGAQHER